MAFKLSREENKQVSDCATALTEAKAAIQEAIERYNALLEATRDVRDAIVSRLEDEVSEKSERWQESDKASEVEEFISEWRDMDLDDIEPDIEGHADLLTEAPQS